MPEEGRVIDTGTLRQRFRNVYWMGGGSCAGKSTIARRLADRFGLRVFATDDAMAEHARRSRPEECPLLQRFIAMDMDDRWLNRSPLIMLNTFPWFQGEAFPMIVEDLLVIPPDVRVIVEGFRVLPHLVAPLLPAPNHAVWLLPSPEFRLATINLRGRSASHFVTRTSNPERALANLLERDRMFTERLRSELDHTGLRAIEVDAACAEDDTARLISTILQL